ncbi:MAG: hypothetical protein IJW97_06200 [Clostridia bacterium]|nr:hypothetical protein [Clostridia bacterium]
MNGMNPQSLGYVVITDYVAAGTGRDVSDDIQRVIDEHPMRTIFFPDGEYILGKPICTSANPKHAVALQLSNFAVFKAADDWAHTEAMVRLGAAEPYNTITVNGSNYYFSGGIVDGNMKANGIAIESGRETIVRNVSIKHTFIGLHIKHGANFGSSDADIETVNIVGNNKRDSIGVLIEGYDNTLTNMRIYAVQTGVVLKSGGNFLRNVHPLFCYGYEGADPTEIDHADSVAFHDYDHTNWYDYCYSDQMATGFRLAAGSRATLMNCFAMWYWGGSREIAIACDGKFDATVTNIKVNFREDTAIHNALLTVGEHGGNGFIENPIINAEAITDKTYEAYVVGKIM